MPPNARRTRYERTLVPWCHLGLVLLLFSGCRVTHSHVGRGNCSTEWLAANQLSEQQWGTVIRPTHTVGPTELTASTTGEAWSFAMAFGEPREALVVQDCMPLEGVDDRTGEVLDVVYDATVAGTRGDFTLVFEGQAQLAARDPLWVESFSVALPWTTGADPALDALFPHPGDARTLAVGVDASDVDVVFVELCLTPIESDTVVYEESGDDYDALVSLFGSCTHRVNFTRPAADTGDTGDGDTGDGDTGAPG